MKHCSRTYWEGRSQHTLKRLETNVLFFFLNQTTQDNGKAEIMKAEFLLVSEARTVRCDNSDIHFMFCKREPWIVLGFTAEETLISGSAL